MSFLPSYSYLLIIFSLASACLLILFLVRHHWLSHPAGLQAAINSSPDSEVEIYTEYIVPLLAYEEKYPSFGRILTLVLSQFPLKRFLKESEFRSAIVSLSNSFAQPDHNRTIVAMSTIVRCLLQDPEVEYRCRKQLPRLVHQFLSEIQLDSEY